VFRRLLYRNYRSSGALNRRFSGRITMVGWFVLVLTGLTAALGADTGSSLAYQTFAFLICAVIVALIGVRFSRRTVEFERSLPKFGSAGEPMPYRMIVRNRSKATFRALSIIEEHADPRPTMEQFLNIPEPGEEKRNWFDRQFLVYRWRWLSMQNKRIEFYEVALPDLPPGALRETEASLMPTRRGIARLAGVIVACPEPFGLFRAFRRIAAPQSVLILPKRYRLPAFELPGSTKYQQGGVSMALSIGESEEFVSLREYRPGDPLRRVHWKSFAKAGKPLVKEFQDEFFVRHALVLDTFGTPQLDAAFEEAVSVAASLAYTIQDHDSLLDLMFIGPQAYCFTSGRGLARIEQILEILATVQMCQDKGVDALETLVLRHLNQMSGCLCVFLSWDEPRQNVVRLLKSRGVPLRVFVITQDERPLEPGIMADDTDNFHTLPIGKIAERLAAL
jgi:uncharacterized protein (DUF58 family)